MNKKILISVSGLFMFASLTWAQGNPIAVLKINGEETRELVAGKPAIIELAFLDPETLQPIHNFVHMHHKLMHFVAIKRDLSSFAHFHPLFDHGTGFFSIAIHLPNSDPDNQDAPRAMLTPGDYYIFSEVKLRDTVITYRFDFKVIPDPESDQSEPIFIDPIYSGNRVTRYFDETGQVAREGDFFKVVLQISTSEGLDGTNIRFIYQILTKTEAGYQPAKQLEPWLMMGAHSILMDTVDQARADDKLYLHMHAQEADESANFAFGLYARAGEMPSGVYKSWIQFRHAGTVYAFPFRFELER